MTRASWIRRRRRAGCAAVALASLAALAACERERPDVVRGDPGPLATGATVVTTALEPGPPVRRVDLVNPYEGDDRALAEGERLYGWMNCAGCHGVNGGGGLGPPFA